MVTCRNPNFQWHRDREYSTHRQLGVETSQLFGCVAWGLSEICFLSVKTEHKINNIHFM